MRWEDERYVKLYTRDTVDWHFLSFEAQGLMTLILRKVDRAGILPLGRRGKRGVAAAIGHPNRVDSVLPALEELIADGCVRVQGDALVLPNFIEAQEAKTSDAQRKRDQRERDRDLAMAGVTEPVDESRSVTESHETGQNVTRGHAESHEVTPRQDKPILMSEKSDTFGEEVFAHWVKVFEKTAGAKFNAKRKAAVKARRKEGYSVEELKLAVEGCAKTPHNIGKNDRGERYDDLELICRTGSQVERFMANAGRPPSLGNIRRDPIRAEDMNHPDEEGEIAF